MRLALFQPDIPQNTGTMMRLCACLGVPIDIIEPCGFPLDEAKLRRAAMDYIEHLTFERHASWTSFEAQLAPKRLILLTTKSKMSYTDFCFHSDDTLMVGRESAGAPEEVHARADAQIRIPLRPELRSLNVAVAAGMALGEALRQTRGFPPRQVAS